MSHDTAAVTGEITTVDGKELPGVVVTLESSSLASPRTTITNAHGNFQEKMLPAGQYEITATLEGFNPVHNSFYLEESETFPIEIQMVPA